MKVGRVGTSMLYIFNNRNSIQIVWDAKLPKHKRQNRMQELDVRFGTLGLIRTYNPG
jgi:hypothetical protein